MRGSATNGGAGDGGKGHTQLTNGVEAKQVESPFGAETARDSDRADVGCGGQRS